MFNNETKTIHSPGYTYLLSLEIAEEKNNRESESAPETVAKKWRKIINNYLPTYI